MERIESVFFQRFLIPLVNASVGRTFLAHTGANFRISFVELTEEQKHRWKDDPNVKCAVGDFGWMLEKASAAVLLEANYGGGVLDDPVASNDLGSFMALIDVRLPYGLWTPFGELRLQGWPERSYKVMALGDQRFPKEIQMYATLNVDHETFGLYWSRIMEPSEHGARLRRALGRFRHARASYYFEDAVLNAFIGLEALFAEHTSEASRIAGKVTRRLTRFILDPDVSQPVANLMQLSSDIRRLYRIRHTIVHGGVPDERDAADATVSSLQLCCFARRHQRCGCRAFLAYAARQN